MFLACHSVNYEVFSEIIEPCVFPPALGGHGTCSFADLAKARPLIQARIAMAPAGCGGNELVGFTDYLSIESRELLQRHPVRRVRRVPDQAVAFENPRNCLQGTDEGELLGIG